MTKESAIDWCILCLPTSSLDLLFETNGGVILAAVIGGVILAATSFLLGVGSKLAGSSTSFGGSDFSGSGLSRGTSVEASA